MVSCGQIARNDSSSELEFIATIGQEFRIREDMWALGITTDQNYKKQVDYIVLVPGVGFSGPEVVSRDRLEKNSIITIVRVLTAKVRFLASPVYVIEIAGSNQFGEVEIRIRLSGDSSDPNLGLDELIYERIN